MSKFFLFSRHNRKKHERPRPKSKILNLLLNFKNVNFIIIGLVILLGTLYIGVVNSTADKGFAVDELSTKLSELKKENQKKELEISSAMSMQNIKRAADEMQLVQVQDAKYVSSASAVALGE